MDLNKENTSCLQTILTTQIRDATRSRHGYGADFKDDDFKSRCWTDVGVSGTEASRGPSGPGPSSLVTSNRPERLIDLNKANVIRRVRARAMDARGAELKVSLCGAKLVAAAQPWGPRQRLMGPRHLAQTQTHIQTYTGTDAHARAESGARNRPCLRSRRVLHNPAAVFHSRHIWITIGRARSPAEVNKWWDPIRRSAINGAFLGGGAPTLTGRRGAAASVLPSEATEVCSSSISTTTSPRTRRVLQLRGDKSAAALRVHSAGQKEGRVPTPGPLVPLLPLLPLVPPLQRRGCLGSMAQPVSPASNGASVVKVIRSTRPGGQTPTSVVHGAAGGGGLRPKE